MPPPGHKLGTTGCQLGLGEAGRSTHCSFTFPARVAFLLIRCVGELQEQADGVGQLGWWGGGDNPDPAPARFPRSPPHPRPPTSPGIMLGWSLSSPAAPQPGPDTMQPSGPPGGAWRPQRLGRGRLPIQGPPPPRTAAAKGDRLRVCLPDRAAPTLRGHSPREYPSNPEPSTTWTT